MRLRRSPLAHNRYMEEPVSWDFETEPEFKNNSTGSKTPARKSCAARLHMGSPTTSGRESQQAGACRAGKCGKTAVAFI